MKYKYAELELYFGSCPSEGLIEGRFKGQDNNKRLIKAIRYINEALSSSYPWKKVQIHEYNLVKNIHESDILTQFIFDNFEGSERIIKPNNCMHGKINFYNNIIIPNYEKKDKKKLIELLKESNHQIKGIDIDNIVNQQKLYKKYPELLLKLDKEMKKTIYQRCKKSIKFN